MPRVADPLERKCELERLITTYLIHRFSRSGACVDCKSVKVWIYLMAISFVIVNTETRSDVNSCKENASAVDARPRGFLVSLGKGKRESLQSTRIYYFPVLFAHLLSELMKSYKSGLMKRTCKFKTSFVNTISAWPSRKYIIGYPRHQHHTVKVCLYWRCFHSNPSLMTFKRINTAR